VEVKIHEFLRRGTKVSTLFPKNFYAHKMNLCTQWDRGGLVDRRVGFNVVDKRITFTSTGNRSLFIQSVSVTFSDTAARLMSLSYAKIINLQLEIRNNGWRVVAEHSHTTSLTSVSLYQTTRRNIPEDGHLQSRRCQNLKSYHIWNLCTFRTGLPPSHALTYFVDLTAHFQLHRLGLNIVLY
jgi:hypothetical protein